MGSTLGTLLHQKKNGGDFKLPRNSSQGNINNMTESKEDLPRHLSQKEFKALRTFTQILVEKEDAGRNSSGKLLNNFTQNSSQKYDNVSYCSHHHR